MSNSTSRKPTVQEKLFLANLVQHSRSGKWMEDDYGFFHCSICGFEFDDPEYTEPECPGCGARMDGGAAYIESGTQKNKGRVKRSEE